MTKAKVVTVKEAIVYSGSSVCSYGSWCGHQSTVETVCTWHQIADENRGLVNMVLHDIELNAFRSCGFGNLS